MLHLGMVAGKKKRKVKENSEHSNNTLQILHLFVHFESGIRCVIDEKPVNSVTIHDLNIFLAELLSLSEPHISMK